MMLEIGLGFTVLITVQCTCIYHEMLGHLNSLLCFIDVDPVQRDIFLVS